MAVGAYQGAFARGMPCCGSRTHWSAISSHCLVFGVPPRSLQQRISESMPCSSSSIAWSSTWPRRAGRRGTGMRVRGRGRRRTLLTKGGCRRDALKDAGMVVVVVGFLMVVIVVEVCHGRRLPQNGLNIAVRFPLALNIAKVAKRATMSTVWWCWW